MVHALYQLITGIKLQLSGSVTFFLFFCLPFFKPIVNKEEDRRQSKKKESLPPADRPTFINFVSAKQRTVTGKTSKKIRTRANDLLNLIEFDTVSFTLFEQHSEKEYDRFIRSFGRMNAMQVSRGYQVTVMLKLCRHLTRDVQCVHHGQNRGSKKT